MSNRSALLESIANTIKDYRAGEIAEPTPQHVDTWVNQFDESVQDALLRELNYVFQRTYFNKKTTKRFLGNLIANEKLAGTEPSVFWKGIKFLDIQRGGNSQHEMLLMLDSILNTQCDLSAFTCGNNPHAFLYLDDVLFTGNRILKDIGDWIKTAAPNNAKVHIVTIAFHRGGKYYAEKNLKAIAKEAQKNIELTWWRCIEIEDRKDSINISDVLRPSILPEDPLVNAYVSNMKKYKPILRQPNSSLGENEFFMTHEGRILLEQEMLKAGVKIRDMCPFLNVYQRPLGNMVLETLGFGSMIVTFRNCPNNAPLALWAGDPWYPLFPRKNN